MNTSRKTALIAQGIYLYALHMDQPVRNNPSTVTKRWLQWARLNPQYVKFVEQEQYALFDKINGEF